MVRRDIGRFGIETGIQAAQLILNNAATWSVIADEMEGIRAPATDAIGVASSLEDILEIPSAAREKLADLPGHVRRGSRAFGDPLRGTGEPRWGVSGMPRSDVR